VKLDDKEQSDGGGPDPPGVDEDFVDPFHVRPPGYPASFLRRR
jgi:hypothetical protein